MTMPYLENCHHSETGWCLECVKALGEENLDLRMALLEVSRITFESRYETGNSLGEPDEIKVKKSNHDQFHKASKMVSAACVKWQI